MQFINIKQLSEALIKRNQTLEKLESIVNTNGFIRVEPDYFEPYERFIQMNKRIQKETLVKILNSDGSISILRPDITSNLIKQIIPKWGMDNELKVYYIASTFRQPLMQPVVETKQLGVEYLGGTISVDQDIIDLILSIFDVFELPFMLEVGQQSFLSTLIKKLQLSETKESELKSIIDYKNQDALTMFIQTLKGNSIEKDILSKIFKLQGSMEDIQKELKGLTLDASMIEAIQQLKVIESNLELKNRGLRVTFDLSMLSKFDYYDGITFKGYIQGIPFPILSGGRYDSLTEEYGKKIPATGFSIDLTALINEVIKDE